MSAGVPLPDRDRKFYDTADIIAIRDAVRALAAVVIPRAHLVWGGQPAITPLIRYVLERMNTVVKAHVTLYQSNFFRKFFPDDNLMFEDVRIVKELGDRETSLLQMRREMLAREHKYVAGIFIGGMEGIIDEFNLFSELHPSAVVILVASTGAAARMLYDQYPGEKDQRLLDDYAYMALFKDLLFKYIN